MKIIFLLYCLSDVGDLTLNYVQGEFRCVDGVRFYINCLHLCVFVCDEAPNCVCRHRTSHTWRLFHQTVAPKRKGTVSEIVLFLYRMSMESQCNLLK
jgi:hypothetical protein